MRGQSASLSNTNAAQMITNPRGLIFVGSVPRKLYAQRLFDFLFVTEQQVKSCLVPCCIAIAHIEVNSGYIIVGYTANVETANSKETRLCIGCRRIAATKSATVKMLELDNWERMQQRPKPVSGSVWSITFA